MALYDGRAYGLFFNNTYRTWFDMGKTSPDRYSFGADGGELDYFVFTGGKERSPKNILADYSKLTGRTPLPPIWALGNQQSRWSYFPESRVREIADGFRINRIPADVIYLDIDYMDGYRVFTWDKKRFPDPPKLISDLKAQGFQTVLIVDPGIKVDENFRSIQERPSRRASLLKIPMEPNCIAMCGRMQLRFPDFTDSKAREWWGRQFKGDIDDGVAGFWNDMNEPGVFMNDKTEKPEILHHPAKTFPYDTPHAGDGLPGTHRRYHNVFGMQMARATFEGVQKLAAGQTSICPNTSRFCRRSAVLELSGRATTMRVGTNLLFRYRCWRISAFRACRLSAAMLADLTTVQVQRTLRPLAAGGCVYAIFAFALGWLGR